MNAELQLILGCIGLGLVIAYALWASMRDDLHALERFAGMDRRGRVAGAGPSLSR